MHFYTNLVLCRIEWRCSSPLDGVFASPDRRQWYSWYWKHTWTYARQPFATGIFVDAAVTDDVQPHITSRLSTFAVIVATKPVCRQTTAGRASTVRVVRSSWFCCSAFVYIHCSMLSFPTSWPRVVGVWPNHGYRVFIMFSCLGIELCIFLCRLVLFTLVISFVSKGYLYKDQIEE